MNYAADNNEDFGTALAFLGLAPIGFILFAWLITAFVAGLIAQDRGRSFAGFFFATLFFLGPFGVGVALLATRAELDHAYLPPKRKVAEGRQRFSCPRCGADSDIPNADTTYECWQCGEVRKVKPKTTAAKS
jgi:DNA-directed RNA polymerase subunit RPC12/RpoP